MVENGWMTVKEAADYAALSTSMLRACFNRGEIPGAVRTSGPTGRWRVKREHIDAWLAEKNGKAN